MADYNPHIAGGSLIPWIQQINKGFGHCSNGRKKGTNHKRQQVSASYFGVILFKIILATIVLCNAVF